MAPYIGQSGSFSLMKNLNLEKVYRTILLNAPISRADISRLTDLNKVTVSNCIKELLSEQIICEEGIVVSENGRPPMMLQLNDRFGVIIGLELSGISTNIIITDIRGNILEKTVRDPKLYSPGELVEMLKTLIDDCNSKYDTVRGVIGLGVALPLNYNQLDELEDNSPMPAWKGVDAEKLLKESFPGLPIEILNTAAAGTIGEIHFGSSNPDTYLAYIHGNWNLKMDVYAGRYTYSSHSSFSGKIGRIYVNKKDYEGAVLLDEVASIRSLVSELYPGTDMSRLEAVEDMHNRQKKGDQAVHKKLMEMIDYLAIGLYDILQLFRPDRICIGGYLGATLANGYVDILNEKLNELIPPYNQKGRKVVCSEFGIFNVGFGCVSWVRDNIISYVFGDE